MIYRYLQWGTRKAWRARPALELIHAGVDPTDQSALGKLPESPARRRLQGPTGGSSSGRLNVWETRTPGVASEARETPSPSPSPAVSGQPAKLCAGWAIAATVFEKAPGSPEWRGKRARQSGCMVGCGAANAGRAPEPACLDIAGKRVMRRGPAPHHPANPCGSHRGPWSAYRLSGSTPRCQHCGACSCSPNQPQPQL